MGPCLSAQQNRNVAAALVIIAHSMKSAANNPPKDVEGNLIELFEKADKSTRTRSPGRRRRSRA